MSLSDWSAEEIARKCAFRYPEPDLHYDFEPHEWMIKAVQQGFDLGVAYALAKPTRTHWWQFWRPRMPK